MHVYELRTKDGSKTLIETSMPIETMEELINEFRSINNLTQDTNKFINWVNKQTNWCILKLQDPTKFDF